MTHNRPYQIVAGDDRDLEGQLADRMGRVIGLEPYETVTAQLERGGTRLTLDGEIRDDRVAVDLDGQVDQAGRWELEWELRDGGGQLLRTVPAEGTMPVVARRPLMGTTLAVAGGETHTVAADEEESYTRIHIEPDGTLALEPDATIAIEPDPEDT